MKLTSSDKSYSVNDVNGKLILVMWFKLASTFIRFVGTNLLDTKGWGVYTSFYRDDQIWYRDSRTDRQISGRTYRITYTHIIIYLL